MILWLRPQALFAEPDFGPGLDRQAFELGLQRLCGDAGVQAVLAFGARARGSGRVDSDLDAAVICREASLDPAMKTERWSHCRGLPGQLGCGGGVDLLVQGFVDA